jgi:TolB-like protein/Tfp pilus assembly protein PilF
MSLFAELRRRNVFRVAVAYSVTAWLVAQVAELALENFGAPEWVMKTLLLFLALGLPLAIVFAWAFELTPEGLRREKDVDRSQSITEQTGKKLNYTIIAVLASALVITVVTHRWNDDTPTQKPIIDEAIQAETQKSIAVLPFVNMSDDKQNEYFSDGISEELLNVLVKVEGLRVASRTSSFSFKDKDTPIPEIAAALKVDHVLEGSVRKAGDTIRVTAQLIDVKTDSHLWSDTYDRKLEDIFVIQDEISAHIVDALKIALGAGEIVRAANHPTENLSAYEDYLRGRHFWLRRGSENIRKAIELFTRATETDPEFARAWSSLAAAHLTMPTYSDEPESDHYPKAMEYARAALSLDPSIADAHSVIGDLLRTGNEWSEAEPYYRKAIELEPKNSTAYLWYAEQLTCVGHIEDAHKNALKANELDPFHPGTLSVLATTYQMKGDIANTRKSLVSSWELGHPSSGFALVALEASLGNLDEAEAIAAKLIGPFGNPENLEGMLAYFKARQEPELLAALIESELATGMENNEEIWRDRPIRAALDYAAADNADKGIKVLLENTPTGNPWGQVWLPHRDAEALRRHPQFGEVLQAARLVEYWDQFGWPPQCSRQGVEITCR